MNPKQSCCLSLRSRLGLTTSCLLEAGEISLLCENEVCGGVGTRVTVCSAPLPLLPPNPCPPGSLTVYKPLLLLFPRPMDIFVLEFLEIRKFFWENFP